MQRLHDEQNINIRFLNKDWISNSVLPSHTGALDKRKNTVILICLSPESRFFFCLSQFFALIFIYLNMALEYYLNIALEYY